MTFPLVVPFVHRLGGRRIIGKEPAVQPIRTRELLTHAAVPKVVQLVNVIDRSIILAVGGRHGDGKTVLQHLGAGSLGGPLGLVRAGLRVDLFPRPQRVSGTATTTTAWPVVARFELPSPFVAVRQKLAPRRGGAQNIVLVAVLDCCCHCHFVFLGRDGCGCGRGGTIAVLLFLFQEMPSLPFPGFVALIMQIQIIARGKDFSRAIVPIKVVRIRRIG
mmetsp:Transcript_11181/g.30861  ORF Transcript_11181/g.30861 Transcript_11181/m.30861 type:complete len:218 (+) Transcript_11181:1349-2002(+)